MRRVKSLALAALAVIALAASAGTAVASAAEINAESYPATILGEASNTEILLEAGGFTCGVNELGGEATEALETFVPTLTHGNCISAFWGEVTINMNGCKLEFHPGVETGEGVSEGTFDVGPAGCGPMTITYGVGGYCTASVPPQSSAGAVQYETRGAGSERHLKITSSVSGLEYTQVGKLCPGGQNTFANGIYSAAWEVRAASEAEEPIGLYIASVPHKPQFESARYPATISGEQGSEGNQHSIEVEAGATSCETGDWSGEATEASTELQLSASYGGCASTLLGEQTFAMNSCSYVLGVANAGPPYVGSVEVTCDEEGDAIEITQVEGSYPCVVKIGAQKDIATATLLNSSGSIDVDLVGNEFAYTQVGYFCPGNGFKLERSFTNGEYTGATTLSGSNGALIVSGEEM